MSVNKKVVKLFYDVLSPYTYFAFEVLTKHCKQHWPSMDLQLNPVLIAALMQETGNSSPAMLPAKASYMTKDLHRLSDYYGIDFKFPEDVLNVMLVRGSMKAQRLLTAIKQECPMYLEDVSSQLFKNVWLKDSDITVDENLKRACVESNISDDMTNKLVSMTQDAQIKEELKKVTAEALQFGAFGLPTYVVEHNGKPQMLFGNDRLFLLAHYLGEKWPLSFGKL